MTQTAEKIVVKSGGDMGKLGKGTAGSRLKSCWRRSGCKVSLKEYARMAAKNPLADVRVVFERKDALEWLSSKRPGGSEAQRAERKEKRQRIRTGRYLKSGSSGASAPKKDAGAGKKGKGRG